jgi:ATP-dependent RNA helicase RhlE
VLVPTRELAMQVNESIQTYGKHLPFKAAVVIGGVGFGGQLATLRRGVDIIVATPGRLLDHAKQRSVDLSKIEFLVLDEADRMLDMGFIPDIRKVITFIPAVRQNLMFSATFSAEIRQLAGAFLKNPAEVEVAARNAPAGLVTQIAHPVDQDKKHGLLAHLVATNNWQQVLVFTRTKRGADRLADQLMKSGIESDAIHGNKSQNLRTRSLARFKNGSLRVLVATDIASRGIDIDTLPHVVNYDMPHVAEDYVHRIGRTGRAGASGEAVSLIGADDRSLLSAVERLINKRVELKVIEGFEPTHSARSAPRSQPGRHGRPGQGNGQGRGQGHGAGAGAGRGSSAGGQRRAANEPNGRREYSGAPRRKAA